MRKTPDTDESVRCTVSGCSCVCFKPGSVQPRSCDHCGHGWVTHALAKPQFQTQPASRCGPVEVALPGLVFDLSSLVLYGAQAVPVRLKILLDRLYSILTQEQVGHILHTLGWSLGDYVRGYMLQHPSGKVLDRWLMVTPEEELLILKQFLRFGETRPIVELMTLQCRAAANPPSDPEIIPAQKSHQSNINTLAEQNGGTPEVFGNARRDGVCRFKKTSPADHDDIVHHLENIPGGPSLLLPFHFPSSALHCLGPPTEALVPPSKLTQCLRKLSGTKLAERHRQERGRRERENDLILLQSKVEPGLKIKDDPDKPIPAHSIWHQDQEIDFHRAKRENTSSLSPSLSSGLIPTSSSSLCLSISSSSSSSPLRISQKLQGSPSYSLNLLPSFSSSFLCPLPTSSFSSALHPHPSSSSSLRPLPSSLCSLPSLSPVGVRKGRVCCGICGKSFYDKGTLKIHYNAVHLKIKHRCTVAGCTMVFSSLRSRNRHSANPNPRLHTAASRDAAHTHRNAHTGLNSETQIHKDKNTRKDTCEEKDISDTLWHQDEEANTLVRAHTLRHRLNGHSKPRNGCQDDIRLQADSPPPPPHPLPQTLSQDANKNVTMDGSNTVRKRAHSAPSLGSPPSLAPLGAPVADKTECRQRLLSFHANQTAPAPLPGRPAITVASQRVRDVTEGKREEALTNQQQRPRQWESGQLVPKKKKPRKSSMPVKIEREKMERGRDTEKEEC